MSITGVIAATAAALALAGSAASAEPRAGVRLAPDPAGLEEAVRLEITVEGADVSRHFDATFQLENLERIGGPSSTTRVQIVNGVPANSRTLTWQLRPKAVGTARVHGIEVEIGDRRLSTRDVSITVQETIPEDRQTAGRSRLDPFDRFFGGDRDDPFERLRRRRPQAPRQAPKIFLRAVAEPARAWVGQQVLYTLYLYTQVDILAIPHQELPEFKGFWARDVPNPQPRPPEMVVHENEQFARFVLEQRALFPRRAGSFELIPAQTRLVARDSAFRSLLASTTELERASNPLTVEVRPLPPAPPGFEGAVGQLRLEGTLEPGELAVGEAATLTLTLSGSGHLQGISEPQLPELPAVKVFAPQQEASDRVRGKKVFGRRVWSFVLVPERPGEWTLPAIEVPYFDPEAGAFRNASVDGLALRARGATSLPNDGGDAVSLHPIRTAALPAARAATALEKTVPWLFAVPWALAGAVLLLRRRAGSGSRTARRALRGRLDAAAGEDDPRRAAAKLEDAWRSYLEARWAIAPGTPSTRWRQALVAAGVREDTAGGLVELTDDLHYLRYAPKLSSTDDLRRELLERSRKLARGLR